MILSQTQHLSQDIQKKDLPVIQEPEIILISADIDLVVLNKLFFDMKMSQQGERIVFLQPIITLTLICVAYYHSLI